MTAPTTPADRVRRFLARYEATHPGCHVLWSDHSDRACPVRLDDLHAVLDIADPSAPRESQ